MNRQLIFESTLKMQKLAGIITESEYNQLVNEGWKENILATAMAVATFLGQAKASNTDPGDSVTKTSIGVAKIKPGAPITIPIGTLFPSGKYHFNDANKKEIASKLKQLGDYIKSNSNSNFNIQIIASESQVPNYDGESSERVSLKPGELAQRRAQVAEFVIKSFVEDLKKQNVVNPNTAVDISTKSIIGKTPYKQGEDPNQEKFTRDQFVNIIVNAAGSVNQQSNKPIYSEENENVFDASRHAIGHLYFPTRRTADVSVAGQGDVHDGQEPLLLKMIDNMGKYTGEEHLIPPKWWNENVNFNTLTPEQIQLIKSGKFGSEVHESTITAPVKPKVRPGTKPEKPKIKRPLTPPKHAPKPAPKAESLSENDQILDKIAQRFKKLKGGN